MFGYIRDLFRSRRSAVARQAELEDGAERAAALNALFERGAFGIADVDLETQRYVRVNPRGCEVLRRSAADLSRLRVSDVIHPDERERISAEWMTQSVSTGRWESDVRHIDAAGDDFWLRVAVLVWKRSPHGVPLRCIAILEDVTDRVRASEELRVSEELMRLSQQIGRIGSYSRNLVNGDITCSTEARRVFGLPEGDGVISAAVWQACVLPEDRERILLGATEAVARQAEEYGAELRTRDPMTGEIKFLELRTRFVYSCSGRPVRSIGVAIDVTQRKEAENRLLHAARHDALTGLPNRAWFRDRLNGVLARAQKGKAFAVLCLDIDRFKEVNDLLGHPAGDRVLVEAAERLTAELREGDVLARLGSDEFGLFRPNLSRVEDAEQLAQRLIGRISEPFAAGSQPVQVSASVGVALAPEHGRREEDLLVAADLALQQAKVDGCGSWRLFEPQMDARLRERRTLEADLRRSLADGDFEVYYQPVIDVATQALKGFEALVRWRHPTQGIVFPVEFIPTCEEIGLIAPLGAWALKRACADAASWPFGLSVAVNLSPAQFAVGRLDKDIADALHESGLEARRLVLEITETVLLHESESILSTLRRIKELGADIAMDDFGAGYSSLNYLQRFPFDIVKIDGGFTSRLCKSAKSRAIVMAIIDLCNALGLKTIAEGVETVEQFEELKRKGCKEAQGYLFSPPRPALEVPLIIDRLRSAAWRDKAA